MSSRSLREQAEDFAASLSTTVAAVVGLAVDPFTARIAGRGPASGEGELFSVRQAPRTGIPLRSGGEVLLTLVADYRCRLDGEGRHLAVDWSSCAVFPGGEAAGEPVMRLEYLRDVRSNGLPVSHWHSHGRSDRLEALLGQRGGGTRRARRRQAKTEGGKAARGASLHLPTGGHRFRPCLEDVLEVLVDDLGVDHLPGTRRALADGREFWRRQQTRAVVRDSPDLVVEWLRNEGFTVTPPTGQLPLPGQSARLREL